MSQGHALARTGCPCGRGFALVLRTGLRPPSRPPCQGRAQLRSAPGERQASGQANAEAGTAALRLGFAGCFVCWLAASRGRLPRGFVSGGYMTSFARFSLRPWLIPPEVLPLLVPPACRVHKKGRTSCLPPFLQSFGIHARRSPSPRLTGQELSKKRGTKRLKHRRKQKFSRAEI